MTSYELQKYYYEQRGCKNKRTYLSRQKARKVAKLMNQRTDSGRIRPYKCQYCDNYHIGHIRQEKSTGTAIGI